MFCIEISLYLRPMAIILDFSARPHQISQLITANGGDDTMTLADALLLVQGDIDSKYDPANACPRCLTQGTTGSDNEGNCTVCYGVGYTEILVERSVPVFTPVSPPPDVVTP